MTLYTEYVGQKVSVREYTRVSKGTNGCSSKGVPRKKETRFVFFFPERSATATKEKTPVPTGLAF
jgi:hypothetical protein